MAENNGKLTRVSDFFDLTPYELIGRLEPFKAVKFPPGEYMTPEQMIAAGNELNRLSANYSFLSTLLCYARVDKRAKQRSGDKNAYQDAIDREDIIECVMKSIDTLYRSINRSTTIRTEVAKELMMTGGMT